MASGGEPKWTAAIVRHKRRAKNARKNARPTRPKLSQISRKPLWALGGFHPTIFQTPAEGPSYPRQKPVKPYPSQGLRSPTSVQIIQRGILPVRVELRPRASMAVTQFVISQAPRLVSAAATATTAVTFV